jgi:hypothetical protein
MVSDFSGRPRRQTGARTGCPKGNLSMCARWIGWDRSRQEVLSTIGPRADVVRHSTTGWRILQRLLLHAGVRGACNTQRAK